VRALTTDPKNRVPHLAFQAGELADLPILPADKFVSAYYLSMDSLDQPGVLADVTRILADLGISIEAILQREPPVKEKATIIILTQRTVEERINRAIAQVEKLPAMVGRVRRIRVEHLNG
jgi:homoserine dehydrogenase